MSPKPCSSKSDASQRADSTRASGVALPYFFRSRASSEPAVDADPDRGAGLGGRLGDLLDLVVELLDVARVHPDRRAARVDRGEDVLRLEVDVGDHRDLRLPGDRGEGVGVVLGRARDPDDLAAGRRQLGDLLERRADVRRTCRRHRLHGYGCVAADRDRADLDLSADPSVGELGRNGRHSERNRSHALCIPKVWIKVPRSAGSSLRGYGTGAGTAAPCRQVHPLVSGRTQRVCPAATRGTEGTIR